jgi:hypothetical protein
MVPVNGSGGRDAEAAAVRLHPCLQNPSPVKNVGETLVAQAAISEN